MGITTPPLEGRLKTRSKKIVQLNEEIIKIELKELVRNSVEETLNGLLEQEAQQL
jgi:putative transposase